MGQGKGGKTTGLSGSSWYKAVSIFNGPLGEPVYEAVATYIMEKAKVDYNIGTVVGGFSAGGGKMELGAATGGIISFD